MKIRSFNLLGLMLLISLQAIASDNPIYCSNLKTADWYPLQNGPKVEFEWIMIKHQGQEIKAALIEENTYLQIKRLCRVSEAIQPDIAPWSPFVVKKANGERYLAPSLFENFTIDQAINSHSGSQLFSKCHCFRTGYRTVERTCQYSEKSF